MRWSSYTPTSSFSPDDLDRIQVFRQRAREFLKNHADLHTPNTHSLTTRATEPKIRIETNIYPGKTRAKALYVDFRFLIMRREKSCFKTLLNILKTKSHPDDLMHKFLDDIKAQFNGDKHLSFNANGKKINLDTLIDLKFNTEYFHVGNAEQATDIKHIAEIFEEDSLQELLFWAVHSKWYGVQCLYTVVKDVGAPDSTIYSPDPRILRD